MMQKIILIALHSLPLAAGVVFSYFFWSSNTTLLLTYLIITFLLIIFGSDRRLERWIFLYGLIAGFVVDTIGTNLSGYQSFTLPQIWGIPYWLPVTWGYGFILMKRISLIIGTGSPWISDLDRKPHLPKPHLDNHLESPL